MKEVSGALTLVRLGRKSMLAALVININIIIIIILNAFAAGVVPRTPLENLTVLPRFPSCI